MADVRELCLRAFRDGRKEDALRLLSKVEKPDPDLVHYSAKHGWLDVCRQLVENYHLSPSNEAILPIDGSLCPRPFHLACFNGRVEVVKYLLTLPTVMPTVNEREDDIDGLGFRPLELACLREHLSVIEVLVSEPSVHMPNDLPSDKFTVLSLLSRRMSGSTEFPITPYFPVFMAGNTDAGKSTLTKAMLQLSQYSRSKHGGEMITDVKTLTAGICPSQCSGVFYLEHPLKPDLSADTGIEVYDLAGHEQYHSSHSAIMASLCLESPAVFVLMVDLTEDSEELRKQIYKWSNMIEIESSSISARVVVVGSRRDELSSKPKLLASKCEFAQRIAMDALGEQRVAGFVALDSRQLSSENIKPFLTLLTKSIKDLAVPGVEYMNFSCHLLYAFLTQVVTATATSFGSLQERVSHHDTLSPFSESVMLASSLVTLADKGLILFLRNNDCLSSSCIIIDKAQLLQEINGTLFAPPSFEEHRQIASNTGMVPVSLLYDIFPQYHDILVAMLTSLQFCRLVEQALLDNISTNLSPQSATNGELLYFPALVSAERPGDLSITVGFGWFTYCTNPHQCLTQRCEDAILLDSAYKYCLSYPTPPALEDPSKKLVRQLCRSCRVWKNGIRWTTKGGTEAIVQVSDEKRCVSLFVSSNQQCRSDSLELRSSVIDTIRSKQKELCSSVEVHEYLISLSHLSHIPDRNFSELTAFAMEDVATSIRDENRSVFDCKRNERISLEHLLHFDPHQVLPSTAVQQLFASYKWSEPVPASFFAGKNPLDEPPNGCRLPQGSRRLCWFLSSCILVLVLLLIAILLVVFLLV